MPIVLIAVVLVAGLLGVVFFTNQPTQPTEDASKDTDAQQPSVTAVTGGYKDGTYTGSGSYGSPAGNETIDVSLTLSEGVITDVSVVGEATNKASIGFQKRFADGVKAVVVGKSIDTVKVSVVAGSSLTPKGFMEAVAKIQNEARLPN